jgi:3-dehydroquinate synthase
MVVACRLSEMITGFNETERVAALLQRYGLPVSADVDKAEVFNVLKMDKKKDSASMNYVLLSKIGEGVTRQIPMDELWKMIEQCK